MTCIYYAHPVDYATGLYEELYKQVEEQLVNAGAVVYTPTRAWQHDGTPRPGLQRGNLAVLGVSDGMVAVWPSSQVSVGVPIEILMALQSGRRVALVTDFKDSWVLSYLMEHSSNHLSLFTIEETSEAVKWIMA